MKFWLEVLAGFLVYALVGWAFVLFYMALRWFWQATDVTLSYNWSKEGTRCHPIFEIRNRSKTKTYLLANIEYSNGSDHLVWFDNKSLMGKELRPESVLQFEEVAPLRNSSTMDECLQLCVAVRLQTGRRLKLCSDEHAQRAIEAAQGVAFRLRDRIDAWLRPMGGLAHGAK